MEHASVVVHADDFRTTLRQAVMRMGGSCNMHAHLDRAHTLSQRYLAHFGMPPRDAPRAPLQVKQGLVGELHNGPAYTSEDLRSRMRASLDASIANGVVRLVTCVDATPDIDLRAIDVALELKAEYSGQILFEIVPHPIFGFKPDERFEKTRWNVFRDACEKCDGVGSLPERDVRVDSIGHTEHLRRTLLLGKELGKPTYVHVGQANDPRERDIFELIDAVKWLDFRAEPYDEPLVWAIHNISSAGFSESDFARVLQGHVEQRIGMICCPRAALSMRQNRAQTAPLHNSIARILEMAFKGITIRLGTDNIADLFVPTSTEDVLDQAVFLADALRFYDVAVLAKFIAGKRLNDNDKEVVRQYLAEDLRAYRRADSNFEFCVPL